MENFEFFVFYCSLRIFLNCTVTSMNLPIELEGRLKRDVCAGSVHLCVLGVCSLGRHSP